jgi:hypothetical protein
MDESINKALKYTSTNLRNNYEIVIEAVKNNRWFIFKTFIICITK